MQPIGSGVHTDRSNSMPWVPGEAESTSGKVKEPRSRHRASVACSACRERRIRCVVPSGEDECIQCKRSGTECIIKDDDERRRPISRAYVNSLTHRIALLESLLENHSIAIPPSTYPPQTAKGPANLDNADANTQPSERPRSHGPSATPAGKNKISSPSVVSDPAVGPVEDLRPYSENTSRASLEIHRTGLGDAEAHEFVERLLSTRGHLSWDQLSGKLRYFGPTSHSHIYRELDQEDVKSSREAHEQVRRAERLIRTLAPETHDYLMHLFFQHYNSVLHVVHEEAFVTDKENGGTRFYSGFLHMCILTMGYRFADKSRPDIQRIALPDRDSTIHREAKYMLDLELERPGGIPSVGALLILGDSEVGVGRDNVGWMYAGMAIRLAYDVGLHLDNRQSGMSQLEVDIRNMTLWACVIYDRYWSLFLGRPTAMKSSDLETYYLAQRFERLGSCRPAGLEGSLITRIYEALLDLMDIGGQIVELPEHREKVSNTSQVPDHSSYLRMMAIDRQLRSWAGRLPEDLRYSKANSSTVPFAFYMLHQQYHAVLILLHRPFARYGNLNTQDGKMTGTLDSHFSNTSIAICTKSAVAIAYIFWQHRKRFDGRLMFSGAMQHAGTAAMALIAALAYTSSAAERSMNMRCLDILHAALQDMSHMLQPAEKMATVLGAAMIALRPGQVSGPPSSTSSHTDDAALAELVDQDATHSMVQSKKYPEKLSTSTPTVSNHRREIGLQSIEASQSYYQLYKTPDIVSRHASVPGWPAFQNSTESLPTNPSFTADPGPIGRSQIHDLQHSYPRSYSVSDPAISGAGLDIQYADTNGGVDFHTVPSETDGARW